MSDLQIMDVTLRDGSYAINFQFTARDTSTIAGELEQAGIDLIEIGHGVGLGASARGVEVAAEADETYMKVAADTLSKAKWGMFCIPGIANIEHIDMAAEYGMGFIRVGTNVSEVAASAPFIERAKHHGMMVCANFMKSYVEPPDRFAETAQQSAGYGADVVYIVDSAGSMLPDELRRYVESTRRLGNVRLGFHGHDNLGLATANALMAVECGISIVDSSLQGLGRSSGNTNTELLLCVLERMGIDLGIDKIKVMDIGERLIVPLINAHGRNSLDTICGYAQFHSSYMSVIREFAGRYRIDPRRLIIALCEHDKINAPRNLVEDLAKQLSQQPSNLPAVPARFQMNAYFGTEQA